MLSGWLLGYFATFDFGIWHNNDDGWMEDDDAGDPHAWQRSYMAVVIVGIFDRSQRSAEVVGDWQSKVEPHPANVAPIPVLGESCTEALPRTAPTGSRIPASPINVRNIEE